MTLLYMTISRKIHSSLSLFVISGQVYWCQSEILAMDFFYHDGFLYSIAGNPNIFCTVRPSSMMAHPTQCAQFYDCSRPASLYGTYLHECQYPQMFDDVSGTCADFTAVNCGSRYEPKAPCKAFNTLTGISMWNVDIDKCTVVHAF